MPAWFAYKNGKIFVLSQREPGPEEQTVPGVPEAQELVVVTRRKGRDTSLEEFTAAQRLLEGAGVGRGREGAGRPAPEPRGPPGESLARWRGTCDIVELTPNV